MTHFSTIFLRDFIDIQCQKFLAYTPRRIFLEKSIAAKYFSYFLEPLHYAANVIFHVFLQESIPAFSIWTFLKMSISKKSAYFFCKVFSFFLGGLITRLKKFCSFYIFTWIIVTNIQAVEGDDLSPKTMQRTIWGWSFILFADMVYWAALFYLYKNSEIFHLLGRRWFVAGGPKTHVFVMQRTRFSHFWNRCIMQLPHFFTFFCKKVSQLFHFGHF